MIRKPLYLSQKLNPHKSVVINGEWDYLLKEYLYAYCKETSE